MHTLSNVNKYNCHAYQKSNFSFLIYFIYTREQERENNMRAILVKFLNRNKKFSPTDLI